MTKFINDNRRARSFAVLDIEMLDANEEYERYRKLDPRPARLRWPFRRVCAAALLTFTVDDEGRIDRSYLDSWAGDDEAAILKALFGRLHLLPDHQLVTWGGLNDDLPIIRMGAMENQLRLPPQLVHGARDRGNWLHRDLAIELKAGAGSHVHLSEIAVRLNLPVKFADRAAMVPKLMAQGAFKRVAAIAEADVLTTALLMCAVLHSLGETAGAKIAQAALVRRAVELRPEARYGEYLERVASRLIAEELSAAAALAA